MKKTRSKIIIKTRAGGYTKIYANGKWQKKVRVIDYHAECSNKDGIKVTCEFDRLKTDKNGSVIYDEAKKDFTKEHIVARIQGGEIMKISEMNKCIEEMRDCYRLKDDETEIILGNILSGDCSRYVTVCTRDENGTQIEMTRRADELNKE